MSTARNYTSKIDTILGFALTTALLGMLAFSTYRIFIAPLIASYETEYAKIRLGGDFEVGQWKEPIPADLTAFMLFQSESISRIEESSTVASHNGYNANVSIKGIDGNYPLYGQLQLVKGDKPPFYYNSALELHGAAVDRRTIELLHLKMGDQFRIARGKFEVTAVIIDEPDPTSGKMALLPRIIISAKGFGATGVIDETPQKVVYRARAKLPADNPIEAVKLRYSSGFHYPEWWWRNWDKSPEPK